MIQSPLDTNELHNLLLYPLLTLGASQEARGVRIATCYLICGIRFNFTYDYI